MSNSILEVLDEIATLRTRNAELEAQLAALRELLQRWFDDCNNTGGADYALWDDTGHILEYFENE